MPDVMKTVGPYAIVREVGRGGMAMVYLARQTDLDRFVALKELGAFHASDPSFAHRFLRESRVAGSLSHPNIVTVHDYFEHEGTPYIAMEYVERGSLRPYVGRMNLAQIGGVLEGLLAGLTHAESQGIVHRDLKPENLMVTADGRVKIADFGIAKATTKMQTGAFLTATGTTVGTPTYMAPEQAMAQDIGPWTDLYSVGCMAFELFTGNVPFHDSDAPMAILLRHVNEPIAPVKSLRPEVDQRISDWIEKLLVKDPGSRTQNAQDAWDDFEEILLSLLGPRWRREARLVEREPESGNGAKPLTPAPFAGTSAGDVASEEFKSFAWGAPASDTGPSAAPPMYTPPPSETTPSIPEPIAEPGFVTFGQPSPAPPTDALIQPPAEVAAPADAETSLPQAFETDIAPPPSRPPTSEPSPIEAGTSPPASAAPAPEPEGVAAPMMPRLVRPDAESALDNDLDVFRSPAPPMPDDALIGPRQRLHAAALAGVVPEGSGDAPARRRLIDRFRRRRAQKAPCDLVDCTVFAPPISRTGATILVQAFAHLPEDAEDASRIAAQLDPVARRRGYRSLEIPVPYESRLAFELNIPGSRIETPVETFTWRGATQSVQFLVSLPAEPTRLFGTLSVAVDGVPAGHVKFPLDVERSTRTASAAPVGQSARRYTCAFVSYATADRDEVVRRVQMLGALGIRYFHDVLSLQPGDRWAQRIKHGIDECDLFLLFWSSAAKESEWVRREVEHALGRRVSPDADPEIRPVILEGPPVPPPWDDLRDLHFDDYLLYVLKRVNEQSHSS
jgi:serine/threonine protein kinase